MTTLKGSNLRILINDVTNHVYDVVAMSTNCTITMNTNTENANHKDIVGLAALPTVNSKGWQIQVDSLDVSNVGAMLTAIKNMTQFQLVWDETSTTDNKTSTDATFSRTGFAYLTDGTFQFDDRTNSTKQLQFTGNGAIDAWDKTGQSLAPASSTSFTKGQFVRLFLSSDNTATPAAVIAAARTLSLHVSLSLEQNSTKDTDGDWQTHEPTELNYDISTSALVRSGDTITSAVGAKGLSDLETIYESSSPVKWQIANVSGDNQRTKGAVIVSGSCIVSQLQINSQVKQSATYQATLTGYGAYTVGS
jgi:predicted secreted protein